MEKEREMTEKKERYTPGPWCVTASCENGTMICSGKPQDKTIAIWPNDGGSMENCANARLIAAAPDMLEALTLIVERLSTMVFKMNVKSHYEEKVAMEAARTAIRKALGE